MERKFRRNGSSKVWEYKNAGCVFNDSNGIRYIDRSNIIVLRLSFKPIKRNEGYIDIVKELK